MNSGIDLKNFGSGTNGAVSSAGLVAPPRRIISRYVVPLLLLSGFIGLGAFVFRESFVQTIDVTVTMPVMASDELRSALASARPAASRDNAPKTPLFQAPGWIEPEPYPIVVSSLRPGTVSSIKVIEGEKVSSGSVIAQLVDDDARLAVASAESTLKLREAQFRAALETWKNPTSLKESVETAQATGDKLQAEARRLGELYELARIEAEVGNTLTRSGYEASLETIRKETELSASRSQLAETQAQIKLNSATLAAATERLALRIEDKQALETAEAELLLARTHLETAQLQLERSKIPAPADGIIMRLMASPGTMLSTDMEPGMTLATMYQPEMLQVRVDVPLSEAAKVKPGLDAEIKVEAMPDQVFRGELVNIVPEFDLQKNILPVKVRIDNPVLELRPEMIARVEFFAENEPVKETSDPTKMADGNTTASTGRAYSETLLVPEPLINMTGDAATVLIVGADSHAVRRELETGKPVANGMVPVISGLRISDKIITSPENVEPGTLVRVKGFVEHATH